MYWTDGWWEKVWQWRWYWAINGRVDHPDEDMVGMHGLGNQS